MPTLDRKSPDPLLFQRDDGLLVAFGENAAGEVDAMFIRQGAYERVADPPPAAPPVADAPSAGARFVHPACPIDCGAEHDRVAGEAVACPICRMRFVDAATPPDDDPTQP